jgi:flagellar hook-length control protein FliK
VTRAEFANRLADSVHVAAQNGRTLRIRLHPPELGALQIEVSLRDGVVTARLEVQTAGAQQTILDSMSHLRDALAQHGTGVERIDVQLAPAVQDDGQAGLRDDSDGRQFTEQHERHDDPSERDGAPEDDERQRSEAKSERSPAHTAYADRIDVEI